MVILSGFLDRDPQLNAAPSARLSAPGLPAGAVAAHAFMAVSCRETKVQS
jgi:hypothetical protein